MPLLLTGSVPCRALGLAGLWQNCASRDPRT